MKPKTAGETMDGVELLSGNLGFGDKTAFESLFKSYYAKLTVFADKFLNDLPASEEIVSDTFVFLWANKDRMEFAISVKSYLYRTVQNKCLNYIRHKKIENEYVTYLLKNNLISETLPFDQGSYTEKELEDQVRRAIETLPPKCREIFKLSRFEYLKNREIAHKLNISEKTVERQITIALEKLRNCMAHLLLLILLIVFL